MKKLLQFCIGPVSGAAISFIMIPLTTHFLLPEELGRASMFYLVQVIFQVVCLGLDQAYTREFHVEENKKNLLLNAIWLPFTLSIGIFIFFALNASFLSRILFDYDYYRLAIWLLGVSGITLVLESFILIKIRMEEKALEYSFYIFVIKMSVAVLTLIFIVFIRTDFLAIVYATIIGQLITRLILFFRYRKMFTISGFKIDKQLSRRMFLFGMPLVISFLFSSLLKISSNIALRFFSDFEQLGLFSAGSKVTNLLLVVQTAFALFWTPTAYKWFKENRNIDDYQLISEAVLAFMSIGFVVLLLSRPLIRILISEQFNEAQYFISFLSFYPIMHTLTSTTTLGINFSRKSYLKIFGDAISLLINIMLNILLIPRFGALGAALAVALSYTVYFLVFTFISFSVWKSFSIKKHLLVISLMLFLCFFDTVYPNYAIFAKLGALILFLVIHQFVIKMMIRAGFTWKKETIK